MLLRCQTHRAASAHEELTSAWRIQSQNHELTSPLVTFWSFNSFPSVRAMHGAESSNTPSGTSLCFPPLQCYITLTTTGWWFFSLSLHTVGTCGARAMTSSHGAFFGVDSHCTGSHDETHTSHIRMGLEDRKKTRRGEMYASPGSLSDAQSDFGAGSTAQRMRRRRRREKCDVCISSPLACLSVRLPACLHVCVCEETPRYWPTHTPKIRANHAP